MTSAFDFWNGKNVFVTGAGGFIGSHLTETLVKAGANVRALVRYNGNNQWGWLDTLPDEVTHQIEICSGDIRDPDYVRSFQKGCDYGFHLAALIAIPYSYVAPRAYVETNVIGTVNVLQACRDQGIERLVCTSTSEVYGTAQYVPIDEKHPVQGQSPYSASKIGADHMAESYARSFDLPVVLLRPFNTYGPRQSMRAFIPNLIRQALVGQAIRVGNLEPTRDFNFVSDTVLGFLLAGQCPEAEGQVVNVGSGVEVTLGDVIQEVQRLVNKPLEVVQETQRFRPEKSEVFRLWACNDKAKALMNYAPQVSLAQGLAQTIAWTEAWLAQPDQQKKVSMYHV